MIESVEKKYDPITNSFNAYKIVKDGVEWIVPNNVENTDYQAIQEWIAEGNTVIDNPPE